MSHFLGLLVVRYDYYSKSPANVSARTGEVGNILLDAAKDFVFCSFSNPSRSGMFPKDYALPIVSECTAIYDYSTVDTTDIPLKKGQLVYLVDKVDSEWWFGCSGGRLGVFPAAYVSKERPPRFILSPPQNSRQSSMNRKSSQVSVATQDSEKRSGFDSSSQINVISSDSKNTAELKDVDSQENCSSDEELIPPPPPEMDDGGFIKDEGPRILAEYIEKSRGSLRARNLRPPVSVVAAPRLLTAAAVGQQISGMQKLAEQTMVVGELENQISKLQNELEEKESMYETRLAKLQRDLDECTAKLKESEDARKGLEKENVKISSDNKKLKQSIDLSQNVLNVDAKVTALEDANKQQHETMKTYLAEIQEKDFLIQEIEKSFQKRVQDLEFQLLELSDKLRVTEQQLTENKQNLLAGNVRGTLALQIAGIHIVLPIGSDEKIQSNVELEPETGPEISSSPSVAFMRKSSRGVPSLRDSLRMSSSELASQIRPPSESPSLLD